MIFSEMELALMAGGHSLEGYKKSSLIPFIKELHEARLVRTEQDQRQSYSEVCENLYLVLLTLEFLKRVKGGQTIANRYASSTASYIMYNEFRTSATDLYNMIYFVQADPDRVEKIFNSPDSRKLREKTHLPIMRLNRWLMNIQREDIYFFMMLERSLSINNSDLKEIRRMLSYNKPTDSDVNAIAARILNALRYRLVLLDIRQEIESVLSGKKITYIG
jgi:hypothetical protein